MKPRSLKSPRQLAEALLRKEIEPSQVPEELPRITNDANDYRCNFCSFKERCWK